MINDLFYDNPFQPYEVLELPRQDHPDRPREPQSAWKGPVAATSINVCRRHEVLFIGGFGDVREGAQRKNAKKYYFALEWRSASGAPLWRYKHCSGSHELILRQVRPSPEIHLQMTAVADGTKVTAVAEDGRTILEKIVTRDERLQQFKAAVHKRCVELDLCTHQTDLTVYHDNVLLTSNTMLKKEFKKNKKNRLPNVIEAPDFDRLPAFRFVIQSRQVPSLSSAWSRRMMQILEGGPVDGDDDATEDESPSPAAKKRKTAVAASSATDVILPCRPSSARTIPTPDRSLLQGPSSASTNESPQSRRVATSRDYDGPIRWCGMLDHRWPQ